MPGLYAYSRKGVKRLMRKHKLSVTPFWKWMYGQTCPILPSGEMGYYAWDVDRYIQWKKKGVKPIWD